MNVNVLVLILLAAATVTWVLSCVLGSDRLDDVAGYLFLATVTIRGVFDVMHHHWAGAAVCGTVAAFLAWTLWFLPPRRRKRGRKALGAKSRALIDSMVRQMRERARPRPVLRPAPGTGAA